MRNLIFSVLLLTLVLNFSCRPKQQKSSNEKISIDTSAVINEGQTITKASFQTLSSNLSNALEEGGVSNALTFCNIEAMPLTDSLSENYNVTIRRVSHRPRNSANQADSLELTSIKKYIEQLEKDGELKPVIHTSGNRIIYHAPIRITSQLCLNCHGTPGADIPSADMEVIKKLYPEDKATGFSIGELRGLWVIEFPKHYFENNERIEKE